MCSRFVCAVHCCQQRLGLVALRAPASSPGSWSQLCKRCICGPARYHMAALMHIPVVQTDMAWLQHARALRGLVSNLKRTLCVPIVRCQC